MIVYQIFVDRFAKEEQKSKVKDWDSPIEGGTHEFYGGNLKGIISKIDYISNFADEIYLTPIFQSSTYHRYDTLDYLRIDSMVGNEDDLKALIKKVHSMGMKIFLDGVFNHVSSKSEMAKKFGSDTIWRGFSDLTELRLEDQRVINSILNVIDQWMKSGIDGFRIDCANDIGMKYLDVIKERINKFNGKMIGEVMTYAKDWLEHMDGVMNYFFRESTLSFLNKIITGVDYVNIMNEMIKNYPLDGLLNSWTILSSHDTPRLSYVLKDEQKIRLAIAIQYVFAGEPMVYYGEEAGMDGGPDPFNRAPMIWEKKNDRLEFYNKMGEIRKKVNVLSDGKIKIWNSGKLLSILRYNEWDDFALFIGNPYDVPSRSRVMIPYSYAFDGLEMEDLNGGKKVKISSGFINVEIDPLNFALFIPKDDIKSYTFFKKR